MEVSVTETIAVWHGFECSQSLGPESHRKGFCMTDLAGQDLSLREDIHLSSTGVHLGVEFGCPFGVVQHSPGLTGQAVPHWVAIHALVHQTVAVIHAHNLAHSGDGQPAGVNRLGSPGLILYAFQLKPVIEQLEHLAFVPGIDLRRAAIGDWLPKIGVHDLLVSLCAQRPRAKLPGGSGRLLPTLRHASRPGKRQSMPSPPGQLQRVVGRLSGRARLLLQNARRPDKSHHLGDKQHEYG